MENYKTKRMIGASPYDITKYKRFIELQSRVPKTTYSLLLPMRVDDEYGPDSHHVNFIAVCFRASRVPRHASKPIL